jgi:hypothetical protein
MKLTFLRPPLGARAACPPSLVRLLFLGNAKENLGGQAARAPRRE